MSEFRNRLRATLACACYTLRLRLHSHYSKLEALLNWTRCRMGCHWRSRRSTGAMWSNCCRSQSVYTIAPWCTQPNSGPADCHWHHIQQTVTIVHAAAKECLHERLSCSWQSAITRLDEVDTVERSNEAWPTEWGNVLSWLSIRHHWRLKCILWQTVKTNNSVAESLSSRCLDYRYTKTHKPFTTYNFTIILLCICFVILVNMTIKFRQFEKNPNAFDGMPNNFQCID